MTNKTAKKKFSTRMPLETYVVNKWQSIKKRALAKNIPFDITVSELKRMLQRKTCYYTGEPLDIHNPKYHPSVDQVEPSKGYKKDNIVICCTNVNTFKSNIEPEAIIRMADKLKELRDAKRPLEQNISTM